LSEVKKYSEEELVFALQQQDQQAFSYLYDNNLHHTKKHGEDFKLLI